MKLLAEHLKEADWAWVEKLFEAGLVGTLCFVLQPLTYETKQLHKKLMQSQADSKLKYLRELAEQEANEQ